MLTDEERAFLDYWKQNRTKELKTWRQLLIGLPLGLIFSLPILINLFSGWYTRANMVARTVEPTVLIVALAIFVFMPYLTKKSDGMK